MRFPSIQRSRWRNRLTKSKQEKRIRKIITIRHLNRNKQTQSIWRMPCYRSISSSRLLSSAAVVTSFLIFLRLCFPVQKGKKRKIVTGGIDKKKIRTMYLNKSATSWWSLKRKDDVKIFYTDCLLHRLEINDNT